MQPPPVPDNELQRLASLRALHILDTPPEERFDSIARLAKSLFDVPIVLITFVEKKRQWFKSVIGLSLTELPREISFCGHAILSDGLFIVPDTHKDPRFADNPLVKDHPRIRFYAGYPLLTLDGNALGTFCIIDSQPRNLTVDDQLVLKQMGMWVENKINSVEVDYTDPRLPKKTRQIASLENTGEVMMLIGHDQHVLMVNRGFSTFFEIPAENIIGSTCLEVSAQLAKQFANPQQVKELFINALEDPEHEFTEYITQVSPRARNIVLISFPLHDANIEHLGRIYVFRDITGQANIIEIFRHQTKHDSLTDLPNRVHFQELIEETVLKTPLGKSLTLLILNINRFKEVNKTFGHYQGDLLLLQVSIRLRDALTMPAIISRLGNDEFAILLPNTGSEEVDAIIHTILHTFEDPFTIADMPVQIDVSIGGAFYPTNGKDASTLLRQADVAMSNAKKTHTSFASYCPNSDQLSSQRLALTTALRQAIAGDTLQLYYQPKADARTGEVHSVEALVRWNHPTQGFIPPDRFIPLAEQTGLIAPLSLWVLKTALAQRQLWHQEGFEFMVSVNLSMWNLRDISLSDTIAELLKKNNLPGSALGVELTESAIMTDMKSALQVLVRLAALGINISLDDFGTGYSSLSYLKRLPIDELKIDRSFIQHIAINQVDAAIVASMVELAHHLGLLVVAEGVEDQTTWNHLAMLGCDMIQGYYLARPMPAIDFEHWMNTRFARV